MVPRLRFAINLILEGATVSLDLRSQRESRYQSGLSEVHRGEKSSNESKCRSKWNSDMLKTSNGSRDVKNGRSDEGK